MRDLLSAARAHQLGNVAEERLGYRRIFRVDAPEFRPGVTWRDLRSRHLGRSADGGSGERGVAHVLELLAAEMRVAMAPTGVTCIQETDAANLVSFRQFGDGSRLGDY